MIKNLIKKLIKQVLIEGIDEIKIGNNTAYIRNDRIYISASTPKIHLEGTEPGASSLSLKEDGGEMIIYDETNATNRTKWSVATGRRTQPLINDSEIDYLNGLLYCLYGDGSDGAMTETANINRSGMLFCTTYDDGGYTVTVNSKCLCIFATTSITISGTVNASGQGGAGGAGGAGGSASAGSAGSSGSAGEFVGASGTGGAGGTAGTTPTAGSVGGTGAGGGGGATVTYAGGSGANATSASNGDMKRFFPNSSYENLMKLLNSAGTGGSGGGGGAGEATGDTGGAGGAGGAGGGCIILCAPSIAISGTLDVSGSAGSAGGDGTGTDAGGGGGGAGGNGGVILIVTANLTESTPTYTVSGGAGGAGGAAVGTAGAGGAGGSGADGITIKMVKT